MSWSYDSSDLDTSTLSGQLNATRFLLGDTNASDQRVENEEVLFALSQNSYNTYKSAAWLARSLASKYANRVDVDLDGALSATYSQLQEHYTALAARMDAMANKLGSGWSVVAGGTKVSDITIAEADGNRNAPAFKRGQFRNPPGDYDHE